MNSLKENVNRERGRFESRDVHWKKTWRKYILFIMYSCKLGIKDFRPGLPDCTERSEAAEKLVGGVSTSSSSSSWVLANSLGCRGQCLAFRCAGMCCSSGRAVLVVVPRVEHCAQGCCSQFTMARGVTALGSFVPREGQRAPFIHVCVWK